MPRMELKSCTVIGTQKDSPTATEALPTIMAKPSVKTGSTPLVSPPPPVSPPPVPVPVTVMLAGTALIPTSSKLTSRISTPGGSMEKPMEVVPPLTAEKLRV